LDLKHQRIILIKDNFSPYCCKKTLEDFLGKYWKTLTTLNGEEVYPRSSCRLPVHLKINCFSRKSDFDTKIETIPAFFPISSKT